VSLTDQLQADLLTAMRGGDVLRRDTLRMAISAAHLAEKEKRAPLTDEETQAVIAREVRKRREAIEAYDSAGRIGAAAQERAEAAILSAYLPEQLGADELLPLVRAAIEETGASSGRDMGRVMGVLMPRVKGRADGKVLSGLVAGELARIERSVPGEHAGGGGSDTPGTPGSAAT
jgi:hypothetical protein